MDRQLFEQNLKRDGYDDVRVNTTAGPKENPEHSHPFDVHAMVVEGALSLDCGGEVRTYKAGETFRMERDCLHSENYGPEGATILSGRRHPARAA